MILKKWNRQKKKERFDFSHRNLKSEGDNENNKSGFHFRNPIDGELIVFFQKEVKVHLIFRANW